MTTTYTVFRSDDSGVFASGLSQEAAARELLTGDGHRFEIRQNAEGGVTLFRSAASPAGARDLHPVFNAADQTALFLRVIAEVWNGCEAMTDEEFQQMLVGSQFCVGDRVTTGPDTPEEDRDSGRVLSLTAEHGGPGWITVGWDSGVSTPALASTLVIEEEE